MAESKANIPHDDFVAKVVKDPKQPPDTILLTGYLGKSSEDGHTRLHFDPELKNYVEIPNDAILHTQEISKEHSSLGGSHVWIKSDAELIHGKVGPSRTKAKFFEGPIGAAAAAAAAVGAGAIGGGGGGGIPGTNSLRCPSPDPFWCPQATLLATQCASPDPFWCPQQTWVCTAPPLTSFCTQVTQCPTVLHGCPTPPALCPPHTPNPRVCIPIHTPGCPVQSAICPSAICPAAAAAGAAVGGPLPPTQFSCPTHAPLLCPHSVQAPCISVPLPQCLPPTPLHPVCPTYVFTQCPTPLHGCPPPTAVTQCPTPLHGCPTPPHICPTPFFPACPPPPTPLCTHAPQCFTPACHTPLQGCPPTPPQLCPTPSINPVACIPHLTQQAPQCVASPGCGPGDPGGPVEQAAFAGQAALLPTSPVVCHLFTPACPSVHQICPTNPVICHPSPLCPSIQPHICPTSPVFCHQSPFCPSPFCPSVHIPCATTPGCPIPTLGCPFNPGGGGNQ